MRSSPSDTPFKDAAITALFLTVGLGWILLAIWPGALKLTAPVLCPDDKPDAFVLRRMEAEDDPEGAVLTFRLICMDDRGDLVDVGYLRPGLVLAVYFWGAVTMIYVFSGSARASARNRHDRDLSNPASEGGASR
jgi:hypothetical protein